MKTRLYSIVNQYISGIHAGIQTAHAVAELMRNHYKADHRYSWTEEWVDEDATIIVLDGGYQSNLERIYQLMRKVPDLPSAKFHEEQEALNGALTAIAIVLPEYMHAPQYETELAGPITQAAFGGIVGLQISNQFKDLETGEVLHTYTEEEKQLIEAIKGLRLKGA